MKTSRDVTAAVFCAIVVVVCTLLCCGNVEMPFVDDGPYAKTALDFANSGHLVYNGWAAAMLGAQAIWGALWIRLFGFSFVVLRLSTLPLAAGCAMALYALCRRNGLSSRLAILGSLAVMLAPITLVHCASFMTDIPALFFFLWTVYAMVRASESLQRLTSPIDDAAESRSGRASLVGWLVLASALSAAGGSIRQVVWFVPLTALPYWILRYQLLRRHPFAAGLLVLFFVVNLGTCLAAIHWFAQQPYAINEKDGQAVRYLLHHLRRKSLRLYLERCVWFFLLTVVWYSLPVIAPSLGRMCRKVRRYSLRRNIAVGVIACVLFVVMFRTLGHAWRLPWFPPTVGYLELGASTLVPSSEEQFRILPEGLRILLTLGIMLLLVALAVVAIHHGIDRLTGRERRFRLDFTPLPAGTEILTLFVAAYVPALIVHGLLPNAACIWDRYLIFVLPWAALIALGHYGRHAGELHGVGLGLGVAGVSVGALFGIGIGHDYFAMLKAIQTQTQRLTARGVARRNIMAGFEYDFWTQVTEGRYINDRRILLPRGAYHRAAPLTFATKYAFADYVPAVHPRFVVVSELHPSLGPEALPRVKYWGWLTPLRPRYIYVQSVPGQTLGFHATVP